LFLFSHRQGIKSGIKTGSKTDQFKKTDKLVEIHGSKPAQYKKTSHNFINPRFLAAAQA